MRDQTLFWWSVANSVSGPVALAELRTWLMTGLVDASALVAPADEADPEWIELCEALGERRRVDDIDAAGLSDLGSLMHREALRFDRAATELCSTVVAVDARARDAEQAGRARWHARRVTRCEADLSREGALREITEELRRELGILESGGAALTTMVHTIEEREARMIESRRRFAPPPGLKDGISGDYAAYQQRQEKEKAAFVRSRWKQGISKAKILRMWCAHGGGAAAAGARSKGKSEESKDAPLLLELLKRRQSQLALEERRASSKTTAQNRWKLGISRVKIGNTMSKWGKKDNVVTAWKARKWYERKGIKLGDSIAHPKRGKGTVIFLAADEDERVHVEFANKDTHRYNEKSWIKFRKKIKKMSKALAKAKWQKEQLEWTRKQSQDDFFRGTDAEGVEDGASPELQMLVTTTKEELELLEELWEETFALEEAEEEAEEMAAQVLPPPTMSVPPSVPPPPAPGAGSPPHPAPSAMPSPRPQGAVIPPPPASGISTSAMPSPRPQGAMIPPPPAPGISTIPPPPAPGLSPPPKPQSRPAVSSPPKKKASKAEKLTLVQDERNREEIAPPALRLGATPLAVGTWNIGAELPTEKMLVTWFAGGSIDLDAVGYNTRTVEQAPKKRPTSFAVGSMFKGLKKKKKKVVAGASASPVKASMAAPSRGHLPSVFCLGFQEVVELVPQNIVLNPPSCTKRAAELQELVQRALNEVVKLESLSQSTNPYESGVVKSSELFVLVAMERLVGLSSMVFARRSLVMGSSAKMAPSAVLADKVAARVPGLSEIQSSVLALGKSGLGNKGGIAVSFMLHGTSVCFITSHIAAHRKKVGHRIRDVQKIMKQVSFKSVAKNAINTKRHSSAFVSAPASCKKQVQELFSEQQDRLNNLVKIEDAKAKRKSIIGITSKKKVMGVLDHDIAFFCGDLNFRLRALPGAKVDERSMEQSSLDDEDDEDEDDIDDEDENAPSKEEEIDFATTCIDNEGAL